MPIPMSDIAARPEYHASLRPGVAEKAQVSNKAKQENQQIKVWNSHITEHYTVVKPNRVRYRTVYTVCDFFVRKGGK